MPLIDPNMLRNVPLFELLDEQESTLLAQHLDEAHFLAGQLIFSAGDSGGTMYVVRSGKVEIFIKDENAEHVCLAHIEKGGLFGDLSLLDNEHRSASAKALEDTALFVVDRNDLRLLVQAHPDAALDMLAMLGKRIREADRLVGQRVVSRNVNEELPVSTTLGQRLSDLLTNVAGDIRFVYFSLVWFGVWIILNIGLIPGLEPFDPFPFGLLTMVVSLEAIFLSLFVLISQNRQAARDKVRNDVEYEVNIKAELEIRDLKQQVEDLQELMLQHLSKMNAHLQTSTQQNVNNTTNAKG
jgi:CRP/FNR family transcriptional regulator, cyclic AMP receptor protein